MRLDIEGKHITLAPHLMGWIAERLEDLNTPYDDICEARVTFVQQGRRDAVRIELLLAGKSLHVNQHGTTLGAAVDAAFQRLQQELDDVRGVRQAQTPVVVAQENWQAPALIVTKDAARPVSQL
jgi:ribosome-associated translation inhibitor RaiA